MQRLLLVVLFSSFLCTSSSAGEQFEITSFDGEKKITYTVNFGGGMIFEQFTAFDPVSKEFVYLTWQRGDEAPKPVGEVWDHETGKTKKLYRFPNVEHPLTVIPSMESMKVCPVTGDREFTSRRTMLYD